jgi:Cdc6-like AAA superfamily ATPase
MSTLYHMLPYQRRFFDRIASAEHEVARGGNGQAIALYGESGTGKTLTFDCLCDQKQKQGQEEAQRKVPLCRVSVQSGGDAVSIARSILSQLGKPLSATKGIPLKDLEPQLHSAIIACCTLFILIEELGNALLASTPKLRGELARLLKNLWNLHPMEFTDNWALPNIVRGDHRLILVVSGTPNILEALDRDKELGSRFSCRIDAEKLMFFPPESFRDFRMVTEAMARRFQISERVDAHNDGLMARLLLGCDSHLRILEYVLQRAATIFRDDPATDPNDALLRAFDQVGGDANGDHNPFRMSDDAIASRVALLQRRAGAPRKV